MVRNWKRCLLICLPIIVIGLPVAVGGAFLLAYQNKIYPNTYSAGIDLEGLTIGEAEKKLRGKIVEPKKLVLNGESEKWEINNDKIKINYDFGKTAQNAYQQSRQLPITKWLNQTKVNLNFNLDETALKTEIATIAGQIDQPAIPPQINYDSNNQKVEVSQGKLGKKLDINGSTARVINQIKIGQADQSIPLMINKLNDLPTERQLDIAKQKAEQLIAKNLSLTSEYQNFVIEDEQLINFVGFNSHWAKDKISEYLEVIAESINQEPKNAKFEFKEGHAEVFQPSQTGIALNTEKTIEEIISGLDKVIADNSSQTVSLKLMETEPEIKTADTNRLGIKTLISTGDSKFNHSSAARIHNVDLASSKFNGLLIEPGAVFSFNDLVGEVTQKTGYKQAYIIKDGQTIMGTGGGVCQVSTTMFRAALQAGLPIIERHAHAYRVSYYEQDSKAGFDATVYDPSPDLKFKNDTPAYILIQREIDKENRYLAFKFYGTDDGRKVTIENARVWDVLPPPQPKYIDDPNLAPGQTRQIEHAAWGAKAAFDWQVVRDEETIHEKTFYSHYRPWQAVYLKGVER